MDTDALRMQVETDLQDGHLLFMVCATLEHNQYAGVRSFTKRSQLFAMPDLWFACGCCLRRQCLYSGRRTQCDGGYRAADSYVFNPHKWLFTQFDCSAFYVSDPDDLLTVSVFLQNT